MPWGNVKSLRLVAFDEVGNQLNLSAAIDDPRPAAQVEIPPGSTLSGDYRLCLTTVCAEAKKTAVVLLWAYLVPGKSPLAACTGVAFIPRQH